MNIHKFFNLIMALIFAVSLLGAPTPASAQEYYPTIQVWDSGRVDGIGWPQMSGSMTLTIDDPSTPEAPDFTATGPTFPCPSGADLNCVNIWTGDFQFAVGQIITLTDVITYTKVFTITSLSMKVTDIDPQTDTVSGTADPNSSLFVAIGGIPDDRSRYVTADPSGNWTANFAVAGSGEATYDIIPGTNVYTAQKDEDGDCISTGDTLPVLMLKANFGIDEIMVWGMENGTPISLSIDDPSNGPGEDYSAAKVIEPLSWDPNQLVALFQLQDVFDILPGQLITVTGDGQSRTITVADIWGISIDVDADTVSGYITAGSSASVHAGMGVDSGNLYVDGNGYWIADLGALGVDIKPGSQGYVQVDAQDGGTTWMGFQVPDPRFHVQLNQNNVEGYNWPLGASVTITIDVDNNGTPEFISSPQIVTQADWDPKSTMVRFNNVGEIDLAAGMYITMTDGITTKTHVVTVLTLTSVDPVTDRVTGTAAPDSYMEIGHLCDQNGCAIRRITANALGNWVADFSVPGAGTDPDEQRLFDIKSGTGSEVRQPDEDGDHTDIDWRVPNPRFSVIFPKNEIHGYEWPMGANLTLTIDDPSNGMGVDYFRTKTVGTENFNPPFNTWIGFELGEFMAKPGNIVTMTDGTTTKTHITQEIAVTNVDPLTDTASGTAAPGTNVGFRAGCDNNGCAYRNVPVDASGHWLVDFSVPGDQDNEQQLFDIRLGSSGAAQRIDEDGDETVYDWNVGDPRIFALLEDQRVYAWGWFAGTPLTLTIENPATPQSPDYTGTQVATDIEEWDYGFDWGITLDVQPGYLVTVSGGGITKELAVAPLTVTAVDINADTVSGTGDPGFQIHVGMLCDDNSCTKRNIYVDANGNWFADFSVPGRDDDETVFDIRPGSGTGVYEIDEDNDATSISWNVPNFTFGARPTDDSIEGWQWPLGATITIEIDDPATTETVDYSAQTDVYIPEWSPNETRFDLNFNGAYDLKPGDTVKVTDGIMIKTLVVANFALVEINPNTDMVFGQASPNNQINVWACDNNGCVNREETSDQSGNWQTNFSIPGDLDWEQNTIDIQAGTWVDSTQYDEDNDETMHGRTAGSTITGTVYLINVAPENTVAGVMIEACTTDNFCRTGLTDGSGNYRISGLPAGTYNLRAIPPGTNLPGSLGPVDISYDEILYGQDITVPAPPLPPPPDAVEPAHTGGGTIAVFWMDDLTLTTNGCVNGTASFELSVLEDGYIINGEMIETPVGSGTYIATIPALYPHHGVTEIVYTISCPGGDTVEMPFFIYIDPSGVVKDTSGIPIQNATVTLFHADNPDGPFTEVPNDSTMMSPSNRDNPDTTNANGEFGWDVVAGFYKVRAEKAGCFSPTDPTQTFVESAVLTIPPPVTDLELILKCSSLPPSASAGGPYSINEGDTVTLDASASSDPEAGALTYKWNLDNDSEYDDATGVTTVKTYTDNGVFTIGLRVTDPDNLSATDTAEITVANVSPVVNIQQASVSSLGILTGNGSFADPGTDVWTASVKYGDGAGSQTLALNPDKSFLLNHTYSASGVYTIEVCVSDDDGGSSCNQTQVTVVTNRPPVAKAGGPYVAFEGTAVTLNASKSTDPDHNISRYEWDLDNDGQFDDATGVKPEVTFPDNGIYIVRVRVTDAGGLSSVDRSTATVKNVPPAITSLSFNSPVRVGVKVNANATFKDVGVNDTFTATWKWGDGTNANGVINGHTVTGSHAYARPGIYIVTIIVKDKDGGTSSYFGVVIVLPKK